MLQEAIDLELTQVTMVRIEQTSLEPVLHSTLREINRLRDESKNYGMPVGLFDHLL
jgi:hypothetical protein